MPKLGSFDDLDASLTVFVVVIDSGTLGTSPDLAAVCQALKDAEEVAKEVANSPFVRGMQIKIMQYPLGRAAYPFNTTKGCNPKQISTIESKQP